MALLLKMTWELHLVHNAATHMFSSKPNFCCVITLFQEMHWLPVIFQFKMLVIIYTV